MVKVELIQWKGGAPVQMILSDGRKVPVTHWFDDDGEECGPESEHIVSFAGGEGSQWFAFAVNDFATSPEVFH